MSFNILNIPIVIYATIIGTLFKKQPFANNELNNCILDCEHIYKRNKNLFIIGDLNTSFNHDEKEYSINTETTNKLKEMFCKLNLAITTNNIKQNIDHINIPKSLNIKTVQSKVFIEKGVLSDHKGVFIELL